MADKAFIKVTASEAVENAVNGAVSDSVIAHQEKAVKQQFATAHANIIKAQEAVDSLPGEQKYWADSPQRKALDAAKKALNKAYSEDNWLTYLKTRRADELKGVNGERDNPAPYRDDVYTKKLINSYGSKDFPSGANHFAEMGGGRRRTSNAKYYNKRRGTKRRRSKRHRSKKHRSKKHRS